MVMEKVLSPEFRFSRTRIGLRKCLVTPPHFWGGGELYISVILYMLWRKDGRESRRGAKKVFEIFIGQCS